VPDSDQQKQLSAYYARTYGSLLNCGLTEVRARQGTTAVSVRAPGWSRLIDRTTSTECGEPYRHVALPDTAASSCTGGIGRAARMFHAAAQRHLTEI
jgi:hypothetical protein